MKKATEKINPALVTATYKSTPQPWGYRNFTRDNYAGINTMATAQRIALLNKNIDQVEVVEFRGINEIILETHYIYRSLLASGGEILVMVMTEEAK